ncbi:MAG TPA: methyltransferase domain-containing protein [Candidatus Limnocylindrales bacterium]|nr:methyltransferase domain-containing protein [Candidatus Limnocylindrales bacterium]
MRTKGHTPLGGRKHDRGEGHGSWPSDGRPVAGKRERLKARKPPTELPHHSRIYSDLAGIYDHVFTRVFRRRIDQVVKGLRIPPNAKVLEVGIGTGLSVDAYPPHADVIGIDLSQDMLDQAAQKMDRKRHKHIKLQQGDALNLAFPDESFDFVTAFHVITVVPDPKRMLDEMVRVCRPGGKIVIINHFSSERALIRFVVDRVDPITRHLGWSTKLRLREVLDPGVLVLDKRYKTKPWSLFTIVEARKLGDSRPIRRTR